MKIFQNLKKQDGQILIFTLVFMLILIGMVGSLVGYAGVQIRSHRQAVGREVALNIAEAGAEMAIWKLNHQPYSGETNTPYGAGVYTVTVTTVSGTNKLVKVDSYVPNSVNPVAHRTIQITLAIGTVNLAFNYGVQTGNGGIKMDNNSVVNGNIYANGNIIGSNNGVHIAGTAIVAGATGKIEDVQDIDGNATAHLIEDTTVDGNTDTYSLVGSTTHGSATTTTMSNCSVTGSATYDTKTSCTVGGTSTSPNPIDFIDPIVQPLPITDEQVQEWQTEASVGTPLGTQVINGASSLGPKKIIGDLTLNNGAVLNVTGTLWVTGNIILSQGSTIKLDPGYGSLSGVVVAGVAGSSTAGFIDAQNGAAVNGSDTPGSYLMMLSQRNNTSAPAINVANTAAGAIFYAGYGVIEVLNRASGKELTGYKIHMNQNTSINYEAGLGSPLFTSGPSGGWEVQEQTWQLIR